MTNWANIHVNSKNHHGTLGSTNAAIMPTKTACGESAWAALKAVEVAYKSLIRAALYPAQAEEHEGKAVSAMKNFMAESDLHGSVISLLTCANLHTMQSGLKFISPATFKKNVLRAAIYAQANNGVLCENEDKADKVKVDTKRKTLSFNLDSMAEACGCDKSELIGLTFEQVVAKVAAHAAAQAQAESKAC